MTSETSVNFYKTTRRDIPQDYLSPSYSPPWNLKSQLAFCVLIFKYLFDIHHYTEQVRMCLNSYVWSLLYLTTFHKVYTYVASNEKVIVNGEWERTRMEAKVVNFKGLNKTTNNLTDKPTPSSGRGSNSIAS
jgi:hypothetical protein